MIQDIYEMESGLSRKIASGFRNTFLYGVLVTLLVSLSPLTTTPVSQFFFFVVGLSPAFLFFSLLLKAKVNSPYLKYYVNLILILTILFSAITLRNPEVFNLFYLITAINMTYRDRTLHFVGSAVQLSSYLIASLYAPQLLPVATPDDSTASLMVTRITIFIMVTFLVDIVNKFGQQIIQQFVLREKNITYMSLKDSMGALIQALEAKDIYTNGHSLRTSQYAALIAKYLPDFTDEQALITGATLHDIGKIGISDTILAKAGVLSQEEFEVIKSHPLIGAKILKNSRSLSLAVPMVLHHHERYDGNGYPHGIRGEAIPLEARIMAVVDAYDAMTSNRPYRTALTTDQAYQEIISQTGQQFCPKVVVAFRKAFHEIVHVQDTFEN